MPVSVEVALRKTAATIKLKKKFAKVVMELETPLTCVGKISEQRDHG